MTSRNIFNRSYTSYTSNGSEVWRLTQDPTAYFTTFAYPVGTGCNYREYVYDQSKNDSDKFVYQGQAS